MESIKITVEIAVGKHRAQAWHYLPNHFLVANEDRVIDVTALKVDGDQWVDVLLTCGDMPEAGCRMRPTGRYYTPDHTVDSIELRGLRVPARQGWGIIASREFAHGTSTVSLRITQRLASEREEVANDWNLAERARATWDTRLSYARSPSLADRLRQCPVTMTKSAGAVISSVPTFLMDELLAHLDAEPRNENVSERGEND